VTIAIAAKAPDHSCIVTVSDRRISFDDAVPSLDSAVHKDWSIGGTWGALFAANDTSFAMPIIRRTNELLPALTSRNSLQEVRTAICDAYAHIRNEYVSREYLGAFGFKSVDQFRLEGAATLGDHFGELARKIADDPFEHTTFLVYGYDPNTKDSAHLFEVKNPGNAFSLDHLPYYAIGSGSHIAMASLNLRPVSHLNPLQMIYRALEAKFAAEDSSAVGRSTSVLIQNRGEPMTFLTWATVEQIRKRWEAARTAPPPDISDLIVEHTFATIPKAPMSRT
jgi:hypothetical protein